MIKKKSIIILILLVIPLSICGCNKSSKEDIAGNLLKSIYEVKDYEAYKSAKEKMNGLVLNEISLDNNIGEDVYMSYIEKYRPHTTKKGLERLFSQGIATYMDKLAYSNEIYSTVDSVELEKIETTSENPEYQYTINLILTKWDKKEAGKISGIVGFDKDEKGEYKVSFIKPNLTTSSSIDEMLAKLL